MKDKIFFIREYVLGDEEEIFLLFRDTVRNINIKDYSEAQIKIWAPDRINMEKWRESLASNYTFVAVKKDDNKIIGFADLTAQGELKHGYVHKDYQGQKIGSCLLEIRESKARELSLTKLCSEVSITAKPFFEKHGYTVEKVQIKVKSGVEFVNILMFKEL